MHSRALLRSTAERAADFLEGLADAPVAADEDDVEALRRRLGGPLPDGSTDADTVLDELVRAAAPGVVRSQSPRYFGFVIGGSLPAALAADWMASAWDQNAGGYVVGPSAAVMAEVAGTWLLQLLRLPAGASFAFVTGSQMAHVTCLAAARQHVLAAYGWDVAEQGLGGAPPLRVLAGELRHVTIDRAVRLLGLGAAALRPVPVDDAGRMDARALRDALAAEEGPAIVCAQAGEVNSGAFDPFDAICDAAAETGAWVHVDGAFGLWAAASPSLRHLVAGVERADSWATDAHKWLNVPYDSGLAFCAHPGSHRAALAYVASYLMHSGGGERDDADWTPEFSRRARATPVYAALRALGRAGAEELVDRCCACASRFARLLGDEPGIEVLEPVVLNQVLVRFGDDDALTDAVLRAVQEDGTCWMSGTIWRGRRAMRISVSNWATTAEDVDRSVAAIRAALARHRAAA
jgi:glutamate/tyrosine decarboxylase-like PLP-dependent enzyme